MCYELKLIQNRCYETLLDIQIAHLQQRRLLLRPIIQILLIIKMVISIKSNKSRSENALPFKISCTKL